MGLDWVQCSSALTAGPFIKPNKQMLEALGKKKKKFSYKKGSTFKIKIK